MDTKQSSELKVEEGRQHRLIQDTASALRSRDSLNIMSTHELKGVEEIIKMDGSGVLKTQVMTGIKDAKIQLERCKEAHLEYTLKKEQSTEEDKEWVEGVFKLYEDCNHKVYKYLCLRLN